jgi:hypothetical protein
MDAMTDLNGPHRILADRMDEMTGIEITGETSDGMTIEEMTDGTTGQGMRDGKMIQGTGRSNNPDTSHRFILLGKGT